MSTSRGTSVPPAVMIATLDSFNSSFSSRGRTNCRTRSPAVATLGGGGSLEKKESAGDVSKRLNELRRAVCKKAAPPASAARVEDREGAPPRDPLPSAMLMFSSVCGETAAGARSGASNGGAVCLRINKKTRIRKNLGFVAHQIEGTVKLLI